MQLKGETADLLIVFQHRLCSPGQIYCWGAWAIKGEDSQCVFDIAAQPVVQRPGSADLNHHSGRRVVQPEWTAASWGPLSKQTVPVARGRSLGEKKTDKCRCDSSTRMEPRCVKRRDFSTGSQQQLQPEAGKPFKGMFNWVLSILLLGGSGGCTDRG